MHIAETYRQLLMGGCPSALKHYCGDVLYDYLTSQEMLVSMEGTADTYFKGDTPLEVKTDNNTQWVEGEYGGSYICEPIEPDDVRLYRLDLKKFLSKALWLEPMGVDISMTQCLPGSDVDSYLVAKIPSLGLSVYFSQDNSDEQFRAIQQKAERFDSSVAIVSPAGKPPAGYPVGLDTYQFINLLDIISYIKLIGHEAPLKPYIRSARNQKNTRPYKFCPLLKKVRQYGWEDLAVRVGRESFTVEYGNKSSTYECCEVEFSKQPLNSNRPTTVQYAVLQILAYMGRWNKLGAKDQKQLCLLNGSLQMFFGLDTRFYEYVPKDRKTGEGGYFHPRLKLVLERSLQNDFAKMLADQRDSLTDGGFTKMLSLGNIPERKAGVYTQDNTPFEGR